MHPQNKALSVGDNAYLLVKEFCPFMPYWQLSRYGELVIGYGHVRWSTDEFVEITRDYADFLLRWDLPLIGEQVLGRVRVALNQYEFDALVSLYYDIGLDNFVKSGLLAALNNGDRAGAAEGFMDFTCFGRSVMADLECRRKAERWLFLQH